jgi:hypothetical protein
MDTPTSSPTPPIGKLTIPPRSFCFCLLMAIPAALAATVLAKVSDCFVAGFYRGALWPHDDMFSFLTQFVSCAMGGFVFVWLGALMTPKLRGFSVWIFATLGIAGALALGDENGILGFAGQSTGALIAATLFSTDKS